MSSRVQHVEIDLAGVATEDDLHTLLMQRLPLKVGDRVRVLRVTPSVEEQMPEETRQIFRRCVGRILRIDGFDHYGHLELNVMDDGSQSPDHCDHTIWIEAEFVEYVN